MDGKGAKQRQLEHWEAFTTTQRRKDEDLNFRENGLVSRDILEESKIHGQ